MVVLKTAVIFEAERQGYSVDQVEDKAMTVSELLRILEDYDEDDLIIMSHDNGYTYGSIWHKGEAVKSADGEWKMSEW